MSIAKVSLSTFALLAGVVIAVQAAGGIKGGLQRDDSLQRGIQATKGPLGRPQQQQQYLPPPPPPPPQPAPLPQAPQQQAIKGPGQIAPVFNAIRVQPPQAQPIQQQQQQLAIQQQQVQQEQEPIVQQQQQQQEEVDPNAAAQEGGPAIAAPARGAAAAAASEEEANPRPEPYAFTYAFEAGDSATSGSSQREEQQDANGRVTGFYTLKGEDGRDRRVDYVADASGFRATISTNELGTAPKDSADVDWNAQNPSEGQLRAAETATQAARQRALVNPQLQQQQQQQAAASSTQKFSSPRQNAPSASQQQFAASSSANQNQNQNLKRAKGQQLPLQQRQQQIVAQRLQEPFEQIRQTELNARARKSRHAPFYLFTI